SWIGSSLQGRQESGSSNLSNGCVNSSHSSRPRGFRSIVSPVSCESWPTRSSKEDEMPLVLFVVMSLGIVAAALVQCKGPSALRPGLFFGVTVDPEFVRSEEARRIVWGYRRPIIAMAVVCTAALWLAVPRLSGIAAPLTASAVVTIDVMTGIF